jgi:hypothetical protein
MEQAPIVTNQFFQILILGGILYFFGFYTGGSGGGEKK